MAAVMAILPVELPTMDSSMMKIMASDPTTSQQRRHNESEMWRSTELPDIARGGVLHNPADGGHSHGGGGEAEIDEDQTNFCEAMAGRRSKMEQGVEKHMWTRRCHVASGANKIIGRLARSISVCIFACECLRRSIFFFSLSIGSRFLHLTQLHGHLLMCLHCALNDMEI